MLERTNNPARRQAEHSKDLSKAHLQPLEVKFTGLTIPEARLQEQILISTYTLANLANARRENCCRKCGRFLPDLWKTLSSSLGA